MLRGELWIEREEFDNSVIFLEVKAVDAINDRLKDGIRRNVNGLEKNLTAKSAA